MGAVALLASAVLAAGCPSAPVSYGVNAERPLEAAPWVAAGTGSQRIVGFLYSYEHWLGDVRIRDASGLVVYAGAPNKVAWFPRRWSGTGRLFVIEGRRLDGPGSFRRQSTRALAPVFYPSGLTIPSEGCWRLTLRSGSQRWTLHVRAIEPPAVPPCDTSRVGRGPKSGRTRASGLDRRGTGVVGNLRHLQDPGCRRRGDLRRRSLARVM